MKFFNSRILTKSISLQEAAAKASSAKQVKSLDDLLAEVKASSNIKTASANSNQVVASVEHPKEEVQAEQASANVEVKTAGFEEFIKEKKEEKKEKDEDDGVVEVKEEKEEKEEKKEDKLPAFLKGKDEEKKEASAKVTMKVAKKIDFRDWKAEDVVKAWKQHGTVEACRKNVEKFTTDACTYCGLLQTASNEAEKLLKTASSKKEAAPKSKMTMIAKLSKEDRDLLAKYYAQIYGKEYVDALLEDY